MHILPPVTENCPSWISERRNESMCWLTFSRIASKIAGLIPLFVKIKCLLYHGNPFVWNREILYVASVQKISERVFVFFFFFFVFFFHAHTSASNWKLPFLNQRKEKRKYVWLTFSRIASKIARLIPLFVKIKCLLYHGNQFVWNREILYVASVQKISERVFVFFFFFGRT